MASEPSAISEPGHCRFISRNGNHLSRFDALGYQLATLLDVDDAILDGEMIATDDSGRPQFYELLRRTRGVAYVAFDLLWADGTDLRTLPLSARRERLRSILPTDSASVSEALSVIGRGCQFFELTLAHDLEGIVAKRLADPYAPRIRWLKIKNHNYSQQEGRRELFNGLRPSRRIG